MTQLRHVMFDADGVLQHLALDWHSAMEPHLGSRTVEFLHATLMDELPALAGHGDYLTSLAARLADYDVTAPAADLYRSIWCNISKIDATFEVVDALRRNGYGVHLGTNQERGRAAHMRAVMGYDELFDVSC